MLSVRGRGAPSTRSIHRSAVALLVLVLVPAALVTAGCSEDAQDTEATQTTLPGTATTGDALTDPGTIDEGGGPATTESGDPLVTGAHAYARVCSGCHGPEGQGGVGPALTELSLEQEDVRERIVQEHENQVEIEGLSEEEIEAVSLYVSEEIGR